MRVFSATCYRAPNKYYEEWSLSARQALLCLFAGKRCFCAVCRTGIQAESAVQFQQGWKHGRSPLPLLLPRGAIKAAYLEMTSARTPAHRERKSRIFFPFFLPSFPFLSKGNPRQTARDAESCRLANSKQLTKGQPDLQLSHKIKSMQPPVLCKHPLWLFITKWYELWPNLNKI